MELIITIFFLKHVQELEGVYGSASSQKGTRVLIALLLGMTNLFAY